MSIKEKKSSHCKHTPAALWHAQPSCTIPLLPGHLPDLYPHCWLTTYMNECTLSSVPMNCHVGTVPHCTGESWSEWATIHAYTYTQISVTFNWALSKDLLCTSETWGSCQNSTSDQERTMSCCIKPIVEHLMHKIVFFFATQLNMSPYNQIPDTIQVVNLYSCAPAENVLK